MHGMFDHHARVAFAREHADALRDSMRASRRRTLTKDEAGRRKPVRSDTAVQAAPARAQRAA